MYLTENNSCLLPLNGYPWNLMKLIKLTEPHLSRVVVASKIVIQMFFLFLATITTQQKFHFIQQIK